MDACGLGLWPINNLWVPSSNAAKEEMTMSSKTSPSRILRAAARLLVGMFLALAEEGHAWSDERRLREQIAQYHVFMEKHPKGSTQIRENPQLVYDGKFLKSHSEVERFLKARPELRQET